MSVRSEQNVEPMKMHIYRGKNKPSNLRKEEREGGRDGGRERGKEGGKEGGRKEGRKKSIPNTRGCNFKAT